MQNTGWGSGVSDELTRDASCGILVGVRHYFHCILFFFRWKCLWSSEELSEVSEEVMKLASHPITPIFQSVCVAYLAMTERGSKDTTPFR